MQDLDRVRAAIVLALAPILALGIAVGSIWVVGDQPTQTQLRPRSIVWGDRVFTNTTDLGKWLQSRDASYRRWVDRHPAASWWHGKPVAARTAPPAAAAPPSSDRSSLLRILVLAGLGFLLVALLVAAMRAPPPFTGAARRRVAFAGAVAAQGPHRALPATPVPAAPTGWPRRKREIRVYIPPPLESEASATPALEVAPERPKPELPRPGARPARPKLIPLYSPPAEPASEAAPATALHPELVPEPVRSLVPASPEPDPELEPEPEPALALAAPVAEAEPAPAAEITGAAKDLEPPPGALPEPAPPDAEWQTCEIVLWQGFVKSQFFARVTTPEGDEYALAQSPLFRSKDPYAHDEIARSAHIELCRLLLEDGWVPEGRGPLWYSNRFRLPA